jgi:hypothetical protein
MTEGYGKTENLSSQRKEDRREVVIACNLPIMSREILVYAVNLAFGYSHVTNIILILLIDVI